MTPSSESILTAINDAIQADTRVQVDDLVIEQNADDGTIVVEGRVEDIRGKRLAGNAAWSVVRGRYPLRDHIRVRAREHGDLALRDQVVKHLTGESMFGDCTMTVEAGSDRELLHDAGDAAARIGIVVDGPVVTLEGTVPSVSHRRFAEVLCWWAPGCERVNNRLTVTAAEEDAPERDDDEITDAVRMVLEKDPLVHADQLHAGTAGGVVALEGLLPSDEERRLAVMDAWYVPGVWLVVDRIEVRPVS